MKTVIEMAREAEFQVIGQRVFSPVIEGSDLAWLLERFAALVAAAEREACAQVGMLKAVNGIEVSAAIRARGNT